MSFWRSKERHCHLCTLPDMNTTTYHPFGNIDEQGTSNVREQQRDEPEDNGQWARVKSMGVMMKSPACGPVPCHRLQMAESVRCGKKKRTSDEQECKLNDALCTICKLSDQDENLAQVEWLAMRFTHSANLLAP